MQTRLDEGLPLSTLAPDGHYMKAYINRFDQFDQSSGVPRSLQRKTSRHIAIARVLAPRMSLLCSTSVQPGPSLGFRRCPGAGPPAKIFFRNIEQSEEQMQLKMAAAYDAALDAEYLSRELSPATTWLSELQAYAASQQPDAVNADGTIQPAAFYPLLDSFLLVAVRIGRQPMFPLPLCQCNLVSSWFTSIAKAERRDLCATPVVFPPSATIRRLSTPPISSAVARPCLARCPELSLHPFCYAVFSPSPSVQLRTYTPDKTTGVCSPCTRMPFSLSTVLTVARRSRCRTLQQSTLLTRRATPAMSAS